MHAQDDAREPRRFDLGGAAILALALAPIAWALSQIGRQAGRARRTISSYSAPARSALAALAGYAAWERASAQPMTPPRLRRQPSLRRPQRGDAADLCRPRHHVFRAVVRLDRPPCAWRRRKPVSSSCRFTLGVGLLARPFGAVADKIGARAHADRGPARRGWPRSCGWRSATTPRSRPACWRLWRLLGLAFAILVAPLTAAVLSSVARCGRGTCLRHQQCHEPHRAIGRHCARRRAGVIFVGIRASMIGAAALAAAGAGVMAATMPRRAGKRESAMSKNCRAHARHPQGDAERARLRGMPQDRLALGAFTACAAPAATSAVATIRPTRHATKHFHATGHPIMEGYDPPEGWGWCYVDETFVDLPDQTPQRGPIPRFV